MQTDRLGVVVTSCLLILATTAARAQDAPGADPQTSPETNSLLRVGTRVRLLESSGKRRILTGRVLDLDDKNLRLEEREGTAPVELRRSDIGRVQVWTGRHSRTKKGAIIGATTLGLVGVVLGGAVGALAECGPTCGSSAVATGAIGGGLALGAVGAGLGALVGSAVTTDDWQTVKARRVKARLVPAKGGIGAALTIRF